MTAISPHTLGVRNMVIAGESQITVQVKGDVSSYNLSVDGQQNFNIDTNRTIEITDSGHRAHIVRLDGYDYFDVLRKKVVYKAQDTY
ncbi:NAD kinase [bioreactor metagenome]|uniref:NAD kinase n=2 Tax=root TaxID=1 RepID=A0A645JIB4_9ZZZZ